MLDSLKVFLQTWNKNNDDRAKLQHAYFVAALLVLLVAGLASLVNSELGQRLLMVAAILAGLFFANAVSWALLQSFVIQRLSRTRQTKK